MSGSPATAARWYWSSMAVTACPAACRIEAAMLARYPAWQWTQIGPATGRLATQVAPALGWKPPEAR
jgi:hypothetical protein